jgi:formate hydrogenlyase subunit 6/NADH:ubiquinone oxidoreductase subunit I
VDTPCDIACMACEKICPVTAIAWRAAMLQAPVPVG